MNLMLRNRNCTARERVQNGEVLGDWRRVIVDPLKNRAFSVVGAPLGFFREAKFFGYL